VLAHCAAALSRVAAGNLHSFTPALNEIDVSERRRWPLPDILSELTAGYLEAGKVITDAGASWTSSRWANSCTEATSATPSANRLPTPATDSTTPAPCWQTGRAARQPRLSRLTCPAAR